MADATVTFLLNYLKEVTEEHAQLIKDASGKIENLQKDLVVFNAFLEDSVEMRRNNDKTTNAEVEKIRKVVYDMEDVIDSYVHKILGKKSGFYIPKWLKSSVDLHDIGLRAQVISKSVEEARGAIGIIRQEDDSRSLKFEKKNKDEEEELRKLRRPRKKDVVGFEDEEKDLIKRLMKDSESFEVTSLIGMLGLGKTTLAWKVFTQPEIIHKFPIRIWQPISQEFSDRDIFLSILKELTTVTDDIISKKDDEIADLVRAYLERGSFLIVMDDVWETKHWDRIKYALPENNKGKVLITSRNTKVGSYASGPNSKKLRKFTDDESWKLLQQEALHSQKCPKELEDVGKLIAANCDGLPLAVVIIGGILAEKYNTNPIAMAEEWVNVSTRVNEYLHEKDAAKRMNKLISLSYDRLPYHLRSCFLYLGMFPEDYEIPVSKLIRLWIGEGFIQKESCSLEKTAETYLEDLISRNLIKSEKFRHNGKVKTCRLHDTLRDFCRNEAASENLVKEIKHVKGEFDPLISEIKDYRRLAIHSNCLEFISREPSCPSTRSFVCFSKDDVPVTGENSTKLIKAFKYLKVLDVEPFKFQRIDTDIYHLVYMRYLALSSNMDVLPKKFNDLWNLQTLEIGTTSRELLVKADIWKMGKLRHFKTNASAILPKPSKSSEHGKQLESLSMVSVDSCIPELFNQASNLKKLGVQGDLRLLLEGKVASFDSFGKSKCIEKLKLKHDVYPYPSRDRPLLDLPQPHQFPSGIKSLTLIATFLSWEAMSILGQLKKLEVLKLKKEAFMGATWKAVDEGFKSLQLLHIEDTDLIIWNASSHHYPNLRSLVLRNCEKLLAVPIGLAYIENLQSLELYTCKSANASAKAIKEAKTEKQAEGPAFMLSIFPPASD